MPAASKDASWGLSAEAEVRKVKGGRMFLVSVGDRNAEAAKKLASGPEVASAEVDPKLHAVRVALKPGLDDGSFIPERLIADKFKLHSFQEEEINIEHIFLTITKGITS